MVASPSLGSSNGCHLTPASPKSVSTKLHHKDSFVDCHRCDDVDCVCADGVHSSHANEVVDRLIEYNNLVSGLPLMLLITLMSCDCNSYRFFTSMTKGLRAFFAALLGLSYTLYLVHWPLNILFRSAGIFVPDSWDSVVGSWSVEVCFAIFLDMVIMDSFTRAFVAWLQGSAEPNQKTQGSAEPNQKTQRADDARETPEVSAGEAGSSKGGDSSSPQTGKSQSGLTGGAASAWRRPCPDVGIQ